LITPENIICKYSISLAHEKVQALITHGGYNSLTEATFAGVPLVMLPLFGDQHANCRKVQRLGVGVVLSKLNLTVDAIFEALNAVLHNKTYVKYLLEILKL